MADDIIYGQQQMAAIKLDGLPQLCAHFDPISWGERNPPYHDSVYKLNEEQLKMWAEEVNEIRKQILRKAELVKEKEPAEIAPSRAVQEKATEKSRRSVPLSTKKSNPEGLLELQIKARGQTQAGVTSKFKKRHLKDLSAPAREAIVKMYFHDHVLQKDIAKYYKVSAVLVSKLIKEAQEDPEKIKRLRKKDEKELVFVRAIKSIVEELLSKSVPILKAEIVVDLLRKQSGLEASTYQVKKVIKEEMGLGY